MDLELKFLSFLLSAAHYVVPLVDINFTGRLYSRKSESLAPLDWEPNELPISVADRQHTFAIFRLIED